MPPKITQVLLLPSPHTAEQEKKSFLPLVPLIAVRHFF